MDTAQIMEVLLAMREETRADRKADQAKADAHQAKMEANQAKTEAERKSDVKNLQSWMERRMEGRLETEEPGSVEMKPEVADEREVPVQDAVVMPVGEPKEEELTEMAETTHRECEEPKSADIKECQETTVCHEATEADIEKKEAV
jgi:hypothetical protein